MRRSTDEWRDLVDRAAEVGLRIAAASVLFVVIVVVAIFGIVSVAAGFAFRDTFETSLRERC